MVPRMRTGAPGHAAGACPTSTRMPSSAASIPHGRGNALRTRSSPATPVRLSPRLIRVTAEQRQRDDGSGHQHLSGRRRRARTSGRSSIPARSTTRHVRGDPRRGAGPDPLDLRDAHAHRPFAGDAGAEGARPAPGAWPRRRAPRVAGRQLRARRRAAKAANASRSPGATTLRVIHTPGHASNHLCYLLEEEKTLFTGDHVMQASTVVINPPDGDMAAYIGSLRGLLDVDLEWLAPGHGFLMAEPRRAIEWIVAHRLRREAKVVAALRRPRAGAARGAAAGRLRRRAAAHASDGAALAEGACGQAARPTAWRRKRKAAGR